MLYVNKNIAFLAQCTIITYFSCKCDFFFVYIVLYCIFSLQIQLIHDKIS